MSTAAYDYETQYYHPDWQHHQNQWYEAEYDDDLNPTN
jgi:hypothetical protein